MAKRGRITPRSRAQRLDIFIADLEVEIADRKDELARLQRLLESSRNVRRLDPDTPAETETRP